jgi:hypothetical protein
MQPLQYLRQDSLAFGQRFTVSETQHLVAEAIQFLGSDAISRNGPRLEMLAAVEFDNQHRLNTNEVRKVRTDRPLAAELVAVELAVAKRRPQASLSVG